MASFCTVYPEIPVAAKWQHCPFELEQWTSQSNPNARLESASLPVDSPRELGSSIRNTVFRGQEYIIYPIAESEKGTKYGPGKTCWNAASSAALSQER
jgi:hypothetical protein